ncbi:uncharacterized protein LOC131147356 [Malania oleifera]|uniref:uncharacterized protein LOC131147356 n=1 Tax=Malania oleifera TaxID=397392 RepID=UPI0025AE9CF9|nr:uncharacterized protein LOC131147356 [Malania oleifera]
MVSGRVALEDLRRVPAVGVFRLEFRPGKTGGRVGFGRITNGPGHKRAGHKQSFVEPGGDLETTTQGVEWTDCRLTAPADPATRQAAAHQRRGEERRGQVGAVRHVAGLQRTKSKGEAERLRLESRGSGGNGAG